jgi:hypothetical protein
MTCLIFFLSTNSTRNWCRVLRYSCQLRKCSTHTAVARANSSKWEQGRCRLAALVALILSLLSSTGSEFTYIPRRLNPAAIMGFLSIDSSEDKRGGAREPRVVQTHVGWTACITNARSCWWPLERPKDKWSWEMVSCRCICLAPPAELTEL